MAKALTLGQILLPKRTPPAGLSTTNTFNPGATTSYLSAPTYRQHLQDIFTDRTSNDAQQLITDLLKFDSDASATLHAFLTVANTQMRSLVYDAQGELDPAGQKQFQFLVQNVFQRQDYSTGFEFGTSLKSLCENLRYSILWRGGFAAEVVFDKLLQPSEFRFVDLNTIKWYEKSPGVFKPEQNAQASGEKILLDIPTFFVKYHRQNPTELYPQSMFVSAINLIAARQQVINDLYRIMQKTGYPRLEVTVLEEVLRKNAPTECKTSEVKMATWLNARLAEISTSVSTMRPDAAYVHFEAVKPGMLNESGPGKAFDVKSIIEVLNAQNQAALKTMSTIIGRGESGVNTASVEARMFSLSAQELNVPIADFFSEAFTLILRMTGYQGSVVCSFDTVELRPALELEAQLTMRQARLLQLLSLGAITDMEFHIQLLNRMPPDGAPELSGTGFMSTTAANDPASTSKTDALGRAISPDGNSQADSNTVPKVKKA